MIIKFEIDDDEPICQLVDQLIINELKEQLSYCKEQIKYYEKDDWSQGFMYVHEEDYKLAKKRKKAIKVLLEYYGVKA